MPFSQDWKDNPDRGRSFTDGPPRPPMTVEQATRRISDVFGGPPQAPNVALREIAGRLQKLSYRDMQKLAAAMQTSLSNVSHEKLTQALLAAADTMENA